MSRASNLARGRLELARQLEEGDQPGDLSTTLMMGATADHILRTSEKAGIERELPKAVKSHYDRAITAGHAPRTGRLFTR